MTLRVVHVTATYPPYRGGTGRVCADQAAWLTRRGYDVTVHCPNLGRQPSCEPGPPRVERLPVLLRYGNAALALGHLGRLRPDLVHLHYPYYGGGDLAWLEAVLRRIPYVVTYHQDVELPGLMGVVADQHHRILGQRILEGARVVMATSLDYARHSRLAPLVARSPDHVVDVPNGVDTDLFCPGPPSARLRANYRLTAKDKLVLFVGSLDRAHYFKGVEVLLRAVAAVDDPNVRLLVVGRGDLRASYQRQAVSLGLARQVIFDDAVEDAELPDCYRLADVAVLPSVGRGEAFGVVLLEALACGTPVIASDLPGVRSVVARTAGGLLTPPGDVPALAGALRALLDDPERPRDLGRHSRSVVEATYAWPRVIDRLEEQYRRALVRD